MDHNARNEHEELDDEELQQLVLEAQAEALRQEPKRQIKRPFPKWIFWMMALTLALSTFGVIFQIYSIPAIEFLQTSSRLLKDEKIAEYKESVVVIVTDDSKGTGFSISSEGMILTNYHVIEGNETVMVAFPEDGRFSADVTHTFPEVDLAIVKVTGSDLPHLQLASSTSFHDRQKIFLVGNPLSFTGIANEGAIVDYVQLPDWERPVIMIDAPVYRGNSGSPVITEDGEVIGVIFATMDHELHGKVGLFIPIDEYYVNVEKQQGSS